MDNRSKSNLFDIIVYSMMIVAVVFVIVQSILGNNRTLHFKITLGIWIVAAVIINDFLEQIVLKTFEGMKPYKVQMYMLYAICDAAMYACFYLFVINVYMIKEPFHYICLLLAIILLIIRMAALRKYNNTSSGAAEIAEQLKEADMATDSDDDLKVLIYRDKNSEK